MPRNDDLPKRNYRTEHSYCLSISISWDIVVQLLEICVEAGFFAYTVCSSSLILDNHLLGGDSGQPGDSRDLSQTRVESAVSTAITTKQEV